MTNDPGADADSDEQVALAAGLRLGLVLAGLAGCRRRRPARRWARSDRCGRRPRSPAAAGSKALGRCGFRHRPERSGRRPPRSGTGSRGRRRGARRARPRRRCRRAPGRWAPRSRAAASGRPAARTAQRRFRGCRPRGWRRGSVAGNASATSPSMLTRTRLGWSMDSATPARWAALGGRGQRLDRARTADRGRRGVGDLLQRAAANPLRHHQAAGTGAGDVEHAGDAGPFEAAQLSVRARISCTCSSGRVRVGVDERQRHLPVQRGVEGLPELQPGRTAVEHQQPVASAGDAGAGDEVDVVLAVGRSPSPARGGRRRRRARGWDRRRSRRSAAAARWAARRCRPARPVARPVGSRRRPDAGSSVVASAAGPAGGCPRVGRSPPVLSPSLLRQRPPEARTGAADARVLDELLCSGYVTGRTRQVAGRALQLRSPLRRRGSGDADAGPRPSAASASGTLAASITAAMIGSMISAEHEQPQQRTGAAAVVGQRLADPAAGRRRGRPARPAATRRWSPGWCGRRRGRAAGRRGGSRRPAQQQVARAMAPARKPRPLASAEVAGDQFRVVGQVRRQPARRRSSRAVITTMIRIGVHGCSRA